MKLLEKNEDATLARIKRFFLEADVTLSAHEQLCLKRWSHVHTLMCQRKHTDAAIITEIANVYGVSVYMARSDLYNAQTLYGETMRVNKKLILSLHAESIRLFIEKCKEDKSLIMHVPKLMGEYTKAIDAIPEDKIGINTPPPIINLYVVPGQKVEISEEADTANEKILQKLRMKTDHIENLDYES